MYKTFLNVDVNWENFRKNLLFLKKKCENSQIMPVIKADAYGHGFAGAVKILEEEKAK